MKMIKQVFEKLLKAVPESAGFNLEEINAEFEEAYKEDTLALQNSVDGLKKDVVTWKEKARKAPTNGEGDAKRVLDLEDTIESLKTDYEAKLRTVTAERDSLNSRFSKETKRLNDQLTSTQNVLNRAALDRELTEAMIKGNVANEHLPALKAFLSQGAQVQLEGDVAKVLVGVKPLAEHVTEFLASDAGKHYVRAPGSSGGGAGGSGRNQQQGEKTIPRAEFDKLSPDQKRAKVKDGIIPVD